MIQPGRADMVMCRYTPFMYSIEFPYAFKSTDTFHAQIRAYPSAPTAIVDLNNAATNAEGISVASGSLYFGATGSTVTLRINETTIEGIMASSDPSGGDVTLAWDLHITGGGFAKTRWLEGYAIIKDGVTQ